MAGGRLVLAEAKGALASDGETVGDLRRWLAAAFLRQRPGTRVGASADWTLTALEEAGPSGWELLGVTAMPAEDVVHVAAELGMWRGGWLVGWEDPARWAALVARTGLHPPDHHRWWTAGQAA